MDGLAVAMRRNSVCHILFAVVLFLLCRSGFSEKKTDDKNTLRFVHVIARHGDRSPSHVSFPTDNGNPVWTWNNGWGELTKRGTRQEFELGAFFRRLYIDTGFLSRPYNSSEIYFRSQDLDRTLVSARALAGGMYPPVQVGKEKNNVSWQEVSVHSVLLPVDSVLNMYCPCPTADAYFVESMTSKEAKKFLKDNEDFIKFLESKTGVKIATPQDLEHVYDPLKCEYFHREDHKWPDWVTLKIFQRLTAVYEESTRFYFGDPRVQRFRGSLLFNEIATRNYNKTKDPNIKQKFYVYVTQDVAMLALLEIFGSYNGIMPDYATALIFELHERGGNFFIKILHLNETGSEKFHPVAIKGCETVGECSLAAFVDLARKITPENWYAECGFLEPQFQSIRKLSVATKVLATFTGIFFILFIAAAIWACQRK